MIGTTINFSLFYQQLGWNIQDPFVCIARDVERLKDQVDLILLMSHLGLQNDLSIAEQISGIDVIIGAHTHHVLDRGLEVNGVHITQAGRSGRYVGVVTIERSEDHPFRICSACVPTEKRTEDEATVSTLTQWLEHAENEFSDTIIELAEDLPIDWYKESPLANLLAEGLAQWCDTSLALVNAGQVLDHLKRGYVTKKDIHRILPHPINPCVIDVSGQELLSILQRSLHKDLQQLEVRGFGFRGKKFGALALTGLEVFYTERQEIRAVKVNGKTLQKHERYRIATIDMFTFGHFFSEFHKRIDTTYYMPEFLRDVFTARLAKGRLESAKRQRWISI